MAMPLRVLTREARRLMAALEAALARMENQEWGKVAAT